MRSTFEYSRIDLDKLRSRQMIRIRTMPRSHGQSAFTAGMHLGKLADWGIGRALKAEGIEHIYHLEVLARSTYSCSKGELKVVGAKCLVLDRCPDRLIEQTFISIEVLSHTEPNTK